MDEVSKNWFEILNQSLIWFFVILSGKGGKQRKRGKNMQMGEARELLIAEEG